MLYMQQKVAARRIERGWLKAKSKDNFETKKIEYKKRKGKDKAKKHKIKL